MSHPELDLDAGRGHRPDIGQATRRTGRQRLVVNGHRSPLVVTPSTPGPSGSSETRSPTRPAMRVPRPGRRRSATRVVAVEQLDRPIAESSGSPRSAMFASRWSGRPPRPPTIVSRVGASAERRQDRQLGVGLVLGLGRHLDRRCPAARSRSSSPGAIESKSPTARSGRRPSCSAVVAPASAATTRPIAGGPARPGAVQLGPVGGMPAATTRARIDPDSPGAAAEAGLPRGRRPQPIDPLDHGAGRLAAHRLPADRRRRPGPTRCRWPGRPRRPPCACRRACRRRSGWRRRGRPCPAAPAPRGRAPGPASGPGRRRRRRSPRTAARDRAPDLGADPIAPAGGHDPQRVARRPRAARGASPTPGNSAVVAVVERRPPACVGLLEPGLRDARAGCTSPASRARNGADRGPRSNGRSSSRHHRDIGVVDRAQRVGQRAVPVEQDRVHRAMLPDRPMVDSRRVRARRSSWDPARPGRCRTQGRDPRYPGLRRVDPYRRRGRRAPSVPSIGQIVKSLVFVAPDDDGALDPILCLVSGPNRVDLARLAAVTGEKDVRRATAREANELTGFSIGGIPPIGHSQPIRVVMDPDLGRYPVVWAAAGTADGGLPRRRRQPCGPSPTQRSPRRRGRAEPDASALESTSSARRMTAEPRNAAVDYPGGIRVRFALGRQRRGSGGLRAHRERRPADRSRSARRADLRSHVPGRAPGRVAGRAVDRPPRVAGLRRPGRAAVGQREPARREVRLHRPMASRHGPASCAGPTARAARSRSSSARPGCPTSWSRPRSRPSRSRPTARSPGGSPTRMS